MGRREISKGEKVDTSNQRSACVRWEKNYGTFSTWQAIEKVLAPNSWGFCITLQSSKTLISIQKADLNEPYCMVSGDQSLE